jgi:hypothetical protein
VETFSCCCCHPVVSLTGEGGADDTDEPVTERECAEDEYESFATNGGGPTGDGGAVVVVALPVVGEVALVAELFPRDVLEPRTALKNDRRPVGEGVRYVSGFGEGGMERAKERSWAICGYRRHKNNKALVLQDGVAQLKTKHTNSGSLGCSDNDPACCWGRINAGLLLRLNSARNRPSAGVVVGDTVAKAAVLPPSLTV